MENLRFAVLIDGENIYINDGGVAGFRYYCGRASYADHVISIVSRLTLFQSICIIAWMQKRSM